MGRGKWIAAVAAALAAAGGVLVAAERTGGPETTHHLASRGLAIGVQDNPVFVGRNYYDRETAMRQARLLGASTLRFSLIWADAAHVSAYSARPPAHPAYDFAPWDSAVAAARSRGFDVEIELTGPAPAWATGNRRRGVYRPQAGAFGAFAGAVARHFRGLVDRYSIWNEPNFVAWLAPLADAPALYRHLYEAAWSSMKAADPAAKVLIGETSAFALPRRATAPIAFLRRVTCAGPDYAPARACRELHADGYAHHPYDFLSARDRAHPGPDDATIDSLARLSAALDRLAAARLLATPAGRPLDLYLTEFGYLVRRRGSPSPTRRAALLGRAFAIAAAGYPRVREFVQYELVSPPVGFPGWRDDTSLLSRSGRPDPAFVALARWAREEVRRGRVLPPASGVAR